MADRVDELAVLIEDLKRDNDINNEDYKKLLSEIQEGVKGFRNVEATLNKLQSAINSANDNSEIAEEVKTLADNFRSGFNSVVTFANRDADAKNLLLDRLDALENAVKNGVMIESLRQRTDELVKGYENFISDSNLRHGNMVSALVDLKNKIDDYSSKNNYVYGTIEHSINDTNSKIEGLENSVSSNLGNVNSKLYALGDDIQKILNDGFDHLKYLSSNIAESMNSTSLDMRTTMESLKANILYYSDNINEKFSELNGDITNKIVQSGDSQVMIGNDILDYVKKVENQINNKAEDYENSISAKVNNLIEFINAFKEVFSSANADNEKLLTDKFELVENQFVQLNNEMGNLLKVSSDEIKAVSESIERNSQDVVKRLQETDIAEINNIREELLAKSSANLDSILEKVQNVSDSVNEFKNNTGEKLGDYLSTIKELFVEFSDKIQSSQDNSEILEKLNNIDILISRFDIERNENFERLQSLIESNAAAINEIKNNKSEAFDYERVEHFISGHSAAKDEKLDALNDTVREYKESIDKISGEINAKNQDALSGISELKAIINDVIPSKENIDSVSDRISARVFEAKDEISEKLDSVKDSIEEFANSNKPVNLDYSKIEDIIAEHSRNKDERLDNLNNSLNLTQEDLSDKISDIKKTLISINENNNGNFDAARIETLINEKSSEKNEKLDNISKAINSYQENIDKMSGELNTKSQDTLSEISELKLLANDVLPHKETLEGISESINGKVFECKETLLWEIDTVKSSLDLITSALAEFNPEYDDSALSIKISEMSNQLSEYSQNYEQAFAVVGSKVNEYLEKVEQISTLTNTKLEDATDEFDDIKSRFDELSEKLTNLVGNSGLIEILANIRQQFNVIDDQITKEKEGAVSDVKETLDEMLSVINNNLYLIIQNIEGLYTNNTETSTNLVASLDSGLTSIKEDIEAVINKIDAAVSEKIETLTSEFEPLKDAILSITENNLPREVSSVKSNLELSYANIVSELKDELINSDAFTNIENSFKDTVDKLSALDDSVNYTVSANLDTINNILHTINSNVQSNLATTEDIQSTFQAQLLQIESKIQESRTFTTSSILDGLAEVQRAIAKSNFDPDAIKNVILPLIDNDEMLEVLRGLNKSLADRIQEFKQDTDYSVTELTELVTDVKSTLDKTLEVINSKFENSGEKADRILSTLKEIDSKIDVIVMATNNTSILEEIDDLRSLLGAKKKISKAEKSDESENDFSKIIEKLDLLLASAINSDLTEKLQEIKNKIENISVSSGGIGFEKLNESVDVINNKLDIIAQSSDEELLYEVEEIKTNLDGIMDNLSASDNKLDKYVKTIDAKLDIIAQSTSDSSEFGDVGELHDSLNEIKEQIVSTEENLENYSKNIDYKLDEISQLADVHEKLDAIKSDIKAGMAFETLIKELNNKVDVLAMSEDTDILDEISEIRQIVEDQIQILKTSAENSSIEDSLNKLVEELNKIDKNIGDIDVSKGTSEIKEAVIAAVVAATNEISFVEEAEEIKDFVEERTNELHHLLTEVKRQLVEMNSSSDDMDLYTYTMQDVESDFAKLRLVINDMASKTDTEDLSVISANFNKMAKSLEDLRNVLVENEIQRAEQGDLNEHVVSISSRLNQLLLSQKETDNEIVEKLNNSINAISGLDNKILARRLEKYLSEIYKKSMKTSNLMEVMKNVMMYLGEWMDGTSDTLSTIYDRCTLPDTIEELKSDLPKASEISELIDTHNKEQEENIENLQNIIENISSQNDVRAEELQNAIYSRLNTQDEKLNNIMDAIDNKIAQQDFRLDRIEKQLDIIVELLSKPSYETKIMSKIDEVDEKLTKQNVNIEKLTAYVD